MKNLHRPEFWILALLIFVMVMIVGSAIQTLGKGKKYDEQIRAASCAEYERAGTAQNYPFCHQYYDGYNK